MQFDPYNLKDILLFGGWGKSGRAVLALAEKLGTRIHVFDDQPKPEAVDLPYAGTITGDITNYTTEHKIEAAVVSPGFALSRPEIAEFRKSGLPLLGEANFGNLFLGGIFKIAVTGTDGKSSVVHFTNELLKAAGVKSRAVGNYGFPLCEVALDVLNGNKPEALVIELSSYQLENIYGFEFDVACWTNFAPDHENRYAGLSDYFGAKANLLGCTKGPKVIGNFPALVAAETGTEAAAGSWQNYLNRFHRENRGNDAFLGFAEKLIRYEWGRLVFLGEPFQNSGYESRRFVFPELVYGDSQFQSPSESKIVFRNLQTVLYILEEAGFYLNEQGTHKEIRSALDELSGILSKVLPEVSQLPHRQEFIAEKNGVKFYNDSKATTVQAVAAALQSFDAPIHLLLGGRSKGADFRPLLDYKDKVTYYTYGEAAAEIAGQLTEVHPMQLENTRSVVLAAAGNAKGGDIVLLSPACTSWDEFKSFEERGEFFRKLVESL